MAVLYPPREIRVTHGPRPQPQRWPPRLLFTAVRVLLSGATTAADERLRVAEAASTRGKPRLATAAGRGFLLRQPRHTRAGVFRGVLAARRRAAPKLKLGRG